MISSTIFTLALLGTTSAYPWVPNVHGVDSSLLRASPHRRADAKSCPVNPKHEGAVPYNAKYPYCGAKGSKVQATFPCVNNQVPAPGDDAHRYIAPGPLDIRGPCPGINTAANHGFLSRDGITTYDELVEMQQNVYGVGYDLANLLATLGVSLDGDVVTEKLSIGCDATSRTGSNPIATSGEFGLNGHNKFEGDSSLTRNDYFLANGDNFSFNRTLFDDMLNNYCKGNCNLNTLAKYRRDRYMTSKAGNGNFYFGPLSLLLYGAASFLYTLFPNGGSGIGDPATMKSFFVDEKLPDGWKSRSDAYDIFKVGGQIFSMYRAYPVPFGANRGQPDSFVGFGPSGPFSDEKMGTPDGIRCALYLTASSLIPATLLQSPVSLTAQTWALGKVTPLFNEAAALNPGFASGCPFGPHNPGNPL